MKYDLKGLYLVIDPCMEENLQWKQLEKALPHTNLLQIWDHWPNNFKETEQLNFCGKVQRMAAPYNVPVLINNNISLWHKCKLQGIHFDSVPHNIKQLRVANPSSIIGLTCSNNIETIAEGEKVSLDYYSFCAMFPSSSVDSCEIVQPETVKNARNFTQKPLFISGGVNPDNLLSFVDFDIQGAAIISGIMNSENIENQIDNYKKSLSKILV